MAKDHREIWSFFTGAMGLDLGLEEAGLHPTLANEINPAFCRSIRANRPFLDLIEGDMRELSGTSLRARRQFEGDVYLMAGGPPCQPFSSGGKRAALNDPRGNLIYEYLRLVHEVRPRYFALENVANLTTAALKHRRIQDRPGKRWSLKSYETQRLPGFDGESLPLDAEEMAGSALRQLLADLRPLGYQITFAVVDAADYGAPQKRLRFIMMGARDYPPPSIPEASHGTGRAPHVTVGEAIRHLVSAPGAHSEYTAPVAKMFRLVPPGGTWRDLPKEMHQEALGGAYESGGGKTGFYRRLSWETPAPTITGRANRKGSAMCHPEATRPLSVLECAALQGFPPEWRFEGAMNTQYMQVGNAVPVALGRAIGSAVLAHEASAKKQPWKPDMDIMMAEAIGRLRAAGRNKRNQLIAA